MAKVYDVTMNMNTDIEEAVLVTVLTDDDAVIIVLVA